MINFSTRKPAGIKDQKFVECTRALSQLETIVHRVMHEHHKEVLDRPSPVYWINFHALDIENGRGTINVILIKSQHHLLEIEIQYLIKQDVVQFFEQEIAPINDWLDIVTRLISAM